MRVSKGPAARHKKNRILKEASGFRGKRRNCWVTARQVVRRSKQQAFTGRKLRKRRAARNQHAADDIDGHLGTSCATSRSQKMPSRL